MSENLTNIELNCWLHENLFGAKWYKVSFERGLIYPHLLGYRWLYTDRESAGLLRRNELELSDMTDTPDELEAIFDYCGSLDNAWTVVDGLRPLGWLFDMKDLPDGFPYEGANSQTGSRRICAAFSWSPKENPVKPRQRFASHCNAIADTPARAICEAAKQAVEIEKTYK